MRQGNRYATDPWKDRRHPYKYAPDTLHTMLLDDLKANRPPGGPDEKGVAFLIGACEKIAAHRKVTVEAYWTGLCAEAAALTGRTTVALA